MILQRQGDENLKVGSFWKLKTSTGKDVIMPVRWD